MTYDHIAIPEQAVPQAGDRSFQYVLETYAGETNKVVSVWLQFDEADLDFRPHAKSSSVAEIMKHQLLSERRFFAEFLESAEPNPQDILPALATPESFSDRMVQLAKPRLAHLAGKDSHWWLQQTRFFDVDREHIWIFWRRILHTAHHRTQLTVYLRLLDKKVVSTYGPTADVTWSGADPTTTVEAAGRKASI